MKPFCSRGKNGLNFHCNFFNHFWCRLFFFFVVLSFERLRNKLLYPCVKTYKNVIELN